MRGRNLFPSVLLQHLGQLSASSSLHVQRVAGWNQLNLDQTAQALPNQSFEWMRLDLRGLANQHYLQLWRPAA